jgi:DNA topoisomerase-1
MGAGFANISLDLMYGTPGQTVEHWRWNLETALSLLSLPRDIGKHPESGEMITADIGRYGPYIKHGKQFVSLKSDDDVLSIGINRAVAVIAEAPQKGKAAAKPLKVLGEHPVAGGEVAVYSGRYGPYVKHGKVNATIPKDVEPESITMDEALKLIAERATKSGGKKKAAAKKTATKKKTG